jgi:uncharacterized protein involved in response to NO
MLTGAIPAPAAIHALTAGAIGTMILAVMTRVSLGHTGRPLEADHVTVAIYLMANTAAAARIAAAFASGSLALFLDISAVLWIAGFGLFAIHYGPILIRPRAD